MKSILNTFYLAENDILTERQHGFRTYKSTRTGITTTFERIANALAEKKQVYIPLRDVAKAFDKVWHDGLKYKLPRSGLPDILEKILCNFLDSRKANINFGNSYSRDINQISKWSTSGECIITIFIHSLHQRPSCT